jgi:L-asparaginase
MTTGGTIASKQSGEGLVPVDQGEALASQVPGLSAYADFDVLNVLSIDSSNMNPDDWLVIIKKLYENKDNYDGFVITHGTDTLAYTSSVLSFVLRDLGKPVILTGSMIPMSDPDTDAKRNLLDSFVFMRTLCEKKQNSVSICFAGKLMHGTRVKKYSGKRLDAFNSVFYSDIGRIEDGKAVIFKKPYIDKTTLLRPLKEKSDIRFSSDILPVKIFPGFSAHYFDKLIDIKPEVMVLECFGLGGLPYLGENLLPGVKRAVSNGIMTVITTQCPEGGVGLLTYEVGQKTLKTGAVSAQDMGFEAIVTKLMWLLPQISTEEAADLLTHNFCDEIKK